MASYSWPQAFKMLFCCRFTDKSLSLQSVTIPKGSFVYVSFYALHNSGHLWDNPDKFTPERWLSFETQDATHHVNSTSTHGPIKKELPYLPFSSGPRSCIAQVRMNLSGTNLNTACFDTVIALSLK